jgi:hypothetical protein
MVELVVVYDADQPETLLRQGAKEVRRAPRAIAVARVQV